MGSIAEELERLVKLRDAGDLTPEEFETLKNRLVDSAADEALPPPDQGSVTRRGEVPSVGAASQGKRPIRSWVWCLAALGVVGPLAAARGTSLSVVIAGGAATVFIGWLIDRAIK